MKSLRYAVRADVEKHAKRKRAIKGEIKPGLEFPALCAIAHNCNKKLFKYSQIEFDYEQRESLEYCERTIIEDVRWWLEHNTNEESLRCILDLDRKTRRWLSKRIECWEDYITRAKEISPVPAHIRSAFIKELCVKILDVMEFYPNFVDTFFGGISPDTEEVAELFIKNGAYYQDSRFKKIRNKAVRELKQIPPHLAKYLDTLEVKDKRGFPPKWFTGSKAIMDNLRKKGNRHFIELYRLLKEGSVKHSDTSAVMQKREWNGEGGKLPVLSKADYDQVEKETGLEAQQVRRYLQEMMRHGIIKRVGKDGCGGQMVYSLGHWVQGRAAFPRPVYYLKQTQKMKEALRNFDANYALKE
jgi:hypothetical protein